VEKIKKGVEEMKNIVAYGLFAVAGVLAVVLYKTFL